MFGSCSCQLNLVFCFQVEKTLLRSDMLQEPIHPYVSDCNEVEDFQSEATKVDTIRTCIGFSIPDPISRIRSYTPQPVETITYPNGHIEPVLTGMNHLKITSCGCRCRCCGCLRRR